METFEKDEQCRKAQQPRKRNQKWDLGKTEKSAGVGFDEGRKLIRAGRPLRITIREFDPGSG